MLTNRVLNAQEALDWGVVNQVVADEEPAGRGATTRGQTRPRAYSGLRTSKSAGRRTAVSITVWSRNGA